MSSVMNSVGAIVLAAGLSSRMGGDNKLLCDLDGKPVLRRIVENLVASKASPIVIVTGHQCDAVQELIQDLPVTSCFNENFADGMSTSIAAGIAGVPADLAGVLIVLGDMPLINRVIIDDLIEEFGEGPAEKIVVPVMAGRRGHPVLWGRQYLGALQSLSGDQGGKRLLAEHAGHIVERQFSDQAIFADADTPEALAKLSTEPN